MKTILIGAAGVLIGIVLMGFAAGLSVNSSNQGMMRMMGIDTSRINMASSHDEMSMSQMTAQLENKSGDDFDKAFIEMMISHHRGAVEMAELVENRARHDELRTMSKDIISAQTQEISDMQKWQKDWGYSADEMMQQMH